MASATNMASMAAISSLQPEVGVATAVCKKL